MNDSVLHLIQNLSNLAISEAMVNLFASLMLFAY